MVTVSHSSYVENTRLSNSQIRCVNSIWRLGLWWVLESEGVMKAGDGGHDGISGFIVRGRET